MTIPSRPAMLRTVGCALRATVGQPTGIVLAVAVARSTGLEITESLAVEVEGRPLSVHEVVGRAGTRWHCADAPAGELEVRYDAVVGGRAEAAAVAPIDLIEDVRPSRFVQSDLLAGVLVDAAEVEALTAMPPLDRLTAARTMVADVLEYAPGATTATDGLPEVLDTGQGVCRDYAHLLAGLLRSTDLPARVVSVYAPQLVPMDFHAVVEVAVGGRWWVLDATGLAPRNEMLRIATGRDAADTAFLANDGSSLTLRSIRVHARAEGGRLEQEDDLIELS